MTEHNKNQPRIAWAITGSGHYIEECLEFLLTLENVDLYLSQAGEEVLKMYGVDLKDVRARHPVYRDKAASAPPVGHFIKAIIIPSSWHRPHQTPSPNVF